MSQDDARQPPPVTTLQARLIGLDWGTTALRAYLFGPDGAVLATRALPWGIMKLPRAAHDGGFDAAFQQACGDWLDAVPHLPVIACGMVGSAQGWREAPYIDTPADAASLARGLLPVNTARASLLHIVPGVLERGALPNVMRGEETQILGAMVSDPRLTHDARDAKGALVGLPGTHAKWAQVLGGRIERFTTFMTGEMFAALRDHTILGRTMQTPARPDLDAFLRGVDVARGAAGAGLLATIFSVRTLGLTGQLLPTEAPDYLSGLLIGHELCGLEQLLANAGRGDWSARPVLLIGEPALCERYRLALGRLGCDHATPVAQATERGLWQIALQAGLTRARPDAPARVAP
jgi:2-dehydro-3-deoxygalactonokinase